LIVVENFISVAVWISSVPQCPRGTVISVEGEVTGVQQFVPTTPIAAAFGP